MPRLFKSSANVPQVLHVVQGLFAEIVALRIVNDGFIGNPAASSGLIGLSIAGSPSSHLEADRNRTGPENLRRAFSSIP